MPKDYYENLRLEFFNKIDALKTKNFFEFYKHSPAFFIALNLAYFVLAEEKLISVDKNNNDITSRYKLNMSSELVEHVFEGKLFNQVITEITEKEKKGDNLWFLSALRNSILHGGIEDINLEDMSIKISSTHNLNKLKANIPIDFFSDFIDEFANNRLKNDTVYLIDDLYGFNFQVEISSKKPIKNKEFIKNEIQLLYDKILTTYNEYFQGELPEDENSKDMIQKLLQISAISTRNSKKYDRVVKDIIEEQLTKAIQKHFLDYNLSIRTLPKKATLDYLHYKNTLSYTDYLSQIENFYQNYMENSRIVSDVMNFTDSQDIKKLTPQIVQKRIHEIREKNGENFKYDKILTEILTLDYPCRIDSFSGINHIDMLTAREISRKIYNYKKMDYPAEVIITRIKEHYDTFYKKYNQIFRSKGYISDEDMDVYNKICNTDKISEFYEKFNSDRSKMLVGLLYVFGINMYVINKENNFDNLEEIDDYSFMDNLDIEMYSLVAMKEIENLKSKKISVCKSLKSLIKKHKKYSANPKFPKDKLDDIQCDIDRAKQEINDIDNKLESAKIQKFRNGYMALENNNKRKAAIIRNCLSHNGRIRIIYENNYQGKTSVLLSDYNENNSTAFVKCSIDQLFKFLRHDAFRDSMSNEDTKTINLLKIAENALKGTSTSKADEAKGVEQTELNLENIKEGETKDD